MDSIPAVLTPGEFVVTKKGLQGTIAALQSLIDERVRLFDRLRRGEG